MVSLSQIVRNVLHSEGEGVAERLNSLFRNKHFNMIEFVLKLFEPYYTTNVR